MRNLGLCLALSGALFLAGCGDTTDGDARSGDPGSADAGDAGAGDTGVIALEGAGWDGGAFDPTADSDKVRAIAFFKPG